MRNIFISYARVDIDRVASLVEDIEANDDRPWIDRDVEGGAPWWARILEKIRQCDVFICVVSPSSLESLACQRELAYATALQKSILPVAISPSIDGSSLPVTLAQLNLIPYHGSDRSAITSLYRALRNVPPSRALPNPLPKEPATPLSYVAELRELVTSDEPLSQDQQIALWGKLRQASREEANRSDAIELIARLRKRRDLYAIVAADIDTSDAVKQGVHHSPIPGDLQPTQSTLPPPNLDRTPIQSTSPQAPDWPRWGILHLPYFFGVGILKLLLETLLFSHLNLDSFIKWQAFGATSFMIWAAVASFTYRRLLAWRTTRKYKK